MPRIEKSRVRKISDRVDLETGLSHPRIMDWVEGIIVKSEDALPTIKENAPTSEGDVVEWMQETAAGNVALQGMAADYNKAGSYMLTDGGDGNIPGVSIDNNFAYKSQSGRVVRDRGNAVVMTPTGNYDVPVSDSKTITGKDFLGWAAVPSGGRWIQWNGFLSAWRDLAERPIDQRIRHANVGGLVSPQFFMIPKNRIFRNKVVLDVTSDTPQTLTIIGRTPNDYSNKMFELTQDVPKGESQFSYTIFGLASDHVLHLQPENGTSTVINSIS